MHMNQIYYSLNVQNTQHFMLKKKRMKHTLKKKYQRKTEKKILIEEPFKQQHITFIFFLNLRKGKNQLH